MNKDSFPVFNAKSFKCPHCKTVAQQTFNNDRSLFQLYLRDKYSECGATADDDTRGILSTFVNIILQESSDPCNPMYARKEVATSQCMHCQKLSIWYEEKMLYPKMLETPEATKDMPDKIKKIYDEAREVEPVSPRAAAVLLRIALEELLNSLEPKPKGNSPHEKIIYLLNKNVLSKKILSALDSLRIVGSSSAHSNVQIWNIDLTGKDNRDITYKLFKLINYIVTRTISDDKEVDGIYDALSEEKKIIKKKQ